MKIRIELDKLIQEYRDELLNIDELIQEYRAELLNIKDKRKSEIPTAFARGYTDEDVNEFIEKLKKLK